MITAISILFAVAATAVATAQYLRHKQDMSIAQSCITGLSQELAQLRASKTATTCTVVPENVLAQKCANHV